EVHPSDARRFLALDAADYDLISVNPVPLWPPAATHLYHREFYGLAKTRLRPSGVFEQSLPIGNLGADNISAVLATVHAEFPRIWLYVTGTQGALVACNQDCAPTLETVRTVPGARQLLFDRLLSPDEVDKLLADVNAHGVDLDRLLSTDDNALLEFTTTRRAAQDYERSFKSNMTLLRSFAPSSVFARTRLSAKDLQSPTAE